MSKDGSSIQGKKKGTTYLEGSTSNGKENKILLKITVGTPAKSVKIYGSEYTIRVGSKQKLNYTVLPKNSSTKGVYYKLSKRGVISITSTGIMKALKPGEVSVAICSNDGKAETVITVMVVAELTRNTIYGKVKGTQLSPECVAWFGVPYAKSPTGDLRWRAPQELNPWNGVLSAKTKKAKAAQAKTTVTSIGSEDCLYTNIYRPNNNDTNLPVMVFLHGGSNISGNANRNFKNFAASTNCIVVAVSYRLGAFGWLNLEALKTGDPEEDSGNFALLDIKKALQWVQSNIGYFGGNPGNVTLSGFSAGARNTLACVISPIMKGLFHKVISFSGGMTTSTMDDAQSSAESKLAGVLVKRGVYETRKKALAWVEAANNDEIKALLYSLTTDDVA